MKNVLEYLEHTIENIKDTDKAAFIGGDGGVLSFRGLYDMSRACGSYIIDKNIKKRPIAVFMEKSPAMIAAFFGVVYSGNYYVPLDSEIPALRIRMILETVEPPLIICDNTTIKYVKDMPYQAILFSDVCSFLLNHSALADVRQNAIDTDPLYVVFTSGSTGTPKGVVATHRGVIDYVDNLTEVLQVNSGTVFGNQSPLYLDACLKEVYSTIKYGAAAYLIPQSLFMFPVKLIEYITERKINTICWVASALSLVAGLKALEVQVPHTLRTIAFGSEVFPIKHFNAWKKALPDARFIHLYGPTEATGMSCFFEVKREYADGESIPIGYPFTNTEILLLDESDNLCDIGATGEICIRGVGLSPGYYRDAEKTAAVFVQNPLSPFPDIIYRTGDLGRRGADGELYFVSRRDHQIKHMGHRIELAEIELFAATFDGVGLACAVHDDKSGKILLFYTGDASKSEIKAYLKENLPRYMLPHTITQIDSIPRTPGGKLDRIALLAMYNNVSEGRFITITEIS